MSTLYIKTFPGRPVETVLWFIVSMLGVFSGIASFCGVYYSFFPTPETDIKRMHIYIIVGIPVFIISLILQNVVEKHALKKMNEEK